MALDKQIFDLVLRLHKQNFFDQVKSVVDMGDQDLNLTYENLKKNLSYLNDKNLDELISTAKTFPKRPRLSTSVLWKMLGIKKTARLDIIQLERTKNDTVDEFLKVDLNFPLEKQIELKTYDLVTDFGNNEHPFNVTEAFKSMHKLCNPNGYMIINQALYGGNGFYNFDISYFENIAAVNNYSSIYSCLHFNKDDKYFSTPLDLDYYKMIDLKELDQVGIIYIFQKKKNESFIFPYQGSGKSIKNTEFYLNSFDVSNVFPARTYLPKSINDLSLYQSLHFIVKKIIRKIFKKS